MSEDHSSNGAGRKSWLARLFGVFSSEPRDREELKEILNESLERGVVDTDARAMMEGALEVSEMQVRDAMIPRSQMVVIPRNGKLEDFLPRILESGHSRFPVIGGDRDEVEGILLAKDLLRYFASNGGEFRLLDVIRPAVVIPESKRLNMLLRDFKASRNHMAIVVDEYGGVSGLITIEDVLEEIVGEIDDEHDEKEDAPVVRLSEDRYLVQALTEIDEFNEAFGCELSDEEYDTVGGLLLAEFGRVPEHGEVVVLDGRFEFRVTTSDSRRIITLELNDLDPA
ncbi:MAG: CBS domain-containing protein [Xanthomonadales bacterium]|nr:CBS domain-containing protein [Xanthomonadales bacterium]NIX13634.1 CBS domain-containing protein [Xanthomonadales bacterium]